MNYKVQTFSFMFLFVCFVTQRYNFWLIAANVGAARPLISLVDYVLRFILQESFELRFGGL